MSDDRSVDLGHALLRLPAPARFGLRALSIAAPMVVLVAFASAALHAPLYQATSKLLIEQEQSATLGPAGGDGLAREAARIASPVIAAAVVAALRLDQVPEFAEPSKASGFLSSLGFRLASGDSSPVGQAERLLIDRLDVGATGEGGVVKVTVSAGDPALAARVADAVVAAYLAEGGGRQGVAARPTGRLPDAELADDPVPLSGREDGPGFRARLLAPAALPQVASERTVLPMTAAAAALLLLLVTGFVMLREWMSGRANRRPAALSASPEAAGPAAALPVDGRMRWPEGGDVRRLMPAAPSFAQPEVLPPDVQELMRALVDRIDATHARRIVVTMADDPARARPLAAVALARLLARRGGRVLLLDLHVDGADGAAMASDGQRLTGFSDLLAGEASFAQAIFRDRSSRAHIIPRGTSPLPDGFAADSRLAAILDALDATYDHILLDADRALALMLAPDASALVLVAESTSADPATLAAHQAFAAASKAEILLLIAEPPPEDGATAVA